MPSFTSERTKISEVEEDWRRTCRLPSARARRISGSLGSSDIFIGDLTIVGVVSC